MSFLRPSSRLFGALSALTLTTSLFACSNSGGGGGGGSGAGTTTSAGGGNVTETACDPLTPKAITLGAIVGVGKDVDGTLYVDSANGVFVSDSGKLDRQHVVGSGQSGNNEFAFSFVAPGDNVATARNLLVETMGNTADAMALGPGNSKAFLPNPDPGTTMLSLVDPGTVSGMAVVNTPNTIEYIADVENGNVLMATRPMNDDSTGSDSGLYIFYGPPSAVAQRTITAFEQSLSNTGTLTFVVDGTPYVLAFGNVDAPDAGPFGVFTLMGLTPQGGAQLSVTLRSPTPTTLPSGLSFTCFP